MHTIKVIESVKRQAQRHVQHAKRTAEIDMERHILLCEDLLHLYTHGDTSLLKHLHDLLETTAQRTETIKEWIVKYTGNQVKVDGDKWYMKKNWSRDKFDLEGAEAAPYWTLHKEKKQTNISFETLMKMLKGFNKKIDTAVDEDRFNGDPEVIKALVSNIVSFADVKAKRLTAQQLGTVSNEADKILNAPVASVPAAVVAAAEALGEHVETPEEVAEEAPMGEVVAA